jgi:anthraniloyl-CoA monooxygenase
VLVDDAWGPAADDLVKEASGRVLLTGGRDQAAVLTRFDVGERIRREAGALVVARVPGEHRELAAAALVSGRADAVVLDG